MVDANRESLSQESNDEYNPKHDVDLLKNMVVDAGNLEIIRQKLNKTRAYRLEMLTKTETEMKEHFPYFFSHPFELVNLLPFI